MSTCDDVCRRVTSAPAPTNDSLTMRVVVVVRALERGIVRVDV